MLPQPRKILDQLDYWQSDRPPLLENHSWSTSSVEFSCSPPARLNLPDANDRLWINRIIGPRSE